MRFQCSFCLSLIDTDLDFGSKLVCPSCHRKCFVPRSRFSENRVIGDFVIREKIGGGAAGMVFKATQLSLGRTVALKILPSEGGDSRKYEDFMHEARAAARLNHVNLIQALAIGEEDGLYYLAMNLVDGETLKSRLQREGTLEVDEALHIIQQVAEALWYAWENARMIHRDVKPENIMITPDGIVKLTDMGLAIIQSEFDDDGTICGSPSYMSPEQLSGDSIDTRSDIYSLGITLYEMLAGELPFRAENFEDVAAQHFTEEAVPLRRVNKDIPIKVSNLVRQMMEKQPEDRFEDMNELLDEIWSIRQATAPDSAMIPDVHTISINRLNYDMQRQAANKVPEIGSETFQPPPRDSFKVFIVISIILFILMVASYGYQYYLTLSDRSKAVSVTPLLERVEGFERKFSSGDIAKPLLEIEANNILENFPRRRPENMEALYWKMQYYLSELRNHSTSNQLVERDEYVQELNARLSSEQQGYSTLNEELSSLRQANAVLQKSHKDTDTSSQAEIKKLQTDLANARKAAQNVSSSQVSAWKNQILTSVYGLIRSRDYARCKGYLRYQAEIRPKVYQPWFQSLQDLLAVLEEFDNLFYAKSSKLAGTRVPNEGQVVMVEAGAVFYQSGGTVRSRPWYEFDVKALHSMINQANISIKMNNAQLEAYLAVYGGNLAHPALDKAAPVIKELRKAMLEYSIESVLITSYYNRTQAAAEASALLERFRHDPELEKMIGDALKRLL